MGKSIKTRHLSSNRSCIVIFSPPKMMEQQVQVLSSLICVYIRRGRWAGSSRFFPHPWLQPSGEQSCSSSRRLSGWGCISSAAESPPHRPRRPLLLPGAARSCCKRLPRQRLVNTRWSSTPTGTRSGAVHAGVELRVQTSVRPSASF